MSALDATVQRSSEDVPGSDEGAAAAAGADDRSHGIGDFRIARGGPFYDLQQRLRLLREQALDAGRRAAILIGLAWGVPLVLSAIAGHAIGAPPGPAPSSSIWVPGRASSSRLASSC